jgi:acetyl-CoA carboxylase alpha subunit
MRVRDKEIRRARKREQDQLRARIKEIKGVKAAPVARKPRRPAASTASAPAS